MDYHARNKSEDFVLRMPADGSAFREIEEKWADFKDEPCNVRLSLAADDVNPFRELRSMLGFHWKLTMLIHSESLGLFGDKCCV
jgi:hypothetical protein